MAKKRIQILVDTSRDTGCSNGLIRIEPDNIYQTTNNRDYINETVLKNYDVLTMCSDTSLKYTDAELQLIREFVENGGGLLLATSISRFKRDVREPKFCNPFVRYAFPKTLETHHRSDKRCITRRVSKQIRDSTMPRKNNDIETAPIASVDGLDFEDTGSQVGTI